MGYMPLLGWANIQDSENIFSSNEKEFIEK